MTVGLIATATSTRVPLPPNWATYTPTSYLGQYIDGFLNIESTVSVNRPVDWVSYPELNSSGSPVVLVRTTLRSYTDRKIKNGVNSGIGTFREGGDGYLRLRNTQGTSFLEFSSFGER